MLTNLPLLLPNEALPGWLGAVQAQNVHASTADLCQELLAHPKLNEQNGFPEGAGHLLTKVLKLGRAQSRNALVEHTFLGEVLAFASPEARNSALDAVTDQNSTGVLVHLTAHPPRRQTRLSKRCPACVREDLAQFGRARWRTEHQPLSVLVCADHGISLQWVSRINILSQRSSLAREPTTVGGWVNCIAQKDTGALTRCTELSRISAALLGQGKFRFDADSLRIALRIKTIEKCLATSRHSVGRTMTKAALKSAENDLRRESHIGQLLSNGVPERMVFRPLRTLELPAVSILAELLFGTLESFTSFYADVENAHTEHRQHGGTSELSTWEKFAPIRSIAKISGENCQSALEAIGLKYAQATIPKPRISITPKSTIEIYQRLLGVASRGLTLSEAVRELRISSTELRTLRAEVPSFNDKYSAAKEDYERNLNRAKFVAAVEPLRGQPFNRIKYMSIPGYRWLLRNDSEWLIESIPSLWTE